MVDCTLGERRRNFRSLLMDCYVDEGTSTKGLHLYCDSDNYCSLWCITHYLVPMSTSHNGDKSN